MCVCSFFWASILNLKIELSVLINSESYVSGTANKMKSTKVQTLGGIWRKYRNIWIENTFHAYVLGEHTSMKNELLQTNVKSQGVIYKTSFQHNLH